MSRCLNFHGTAWHDNTEVLLALRVGGMSQKTADLSACSVEQLFSEQEQHDMRLAGLQLLAIGSSLLDASCLAISDL